ncbi:anaphase-promoting complex subunit 2 [Corythoichthys intestinalis]|uniref:anaphase-promoting complex subunit 2 n=1 Tax=Corythoichthys intestinalis TaxID=161448 RepID=UPI0025A54F44|nr:anaphase-promoting complex subunit 2 [Corythoichthys intestinalis]
MEEVVMESADFSGCQAELEVAEAWETVTAALMFPGCGPEDGKLSMCLQVLCAQGAAELLASWLLETLQMRLSSTVVPEFWCRLKQVEKEEEEKGRIRILLTAFQALLESLRPFLVALERLGAWQDKGLEGLGGPGTPGLRQRAFTIIRGLLLFPPSQLLQERVLDFYSRTFSIYIKHQGRVQGPDGGVCGGCGVPVEECWCQEALRHVLELSRVLSTLELQEWVSCDAVTAILHKLIEQWLEQHCRGEFERSFLDEFQEWLELVVGWLGQVFSGQEAGDGTAGSVLKQWRCHMHQFFCRIYVNMRIEELFSIIRDFPESKAAIQDLKFCLERTNQRQQLLTSLKSTFENRLLHPGVHTSDILTVYISAIKTLRELDPSMVVLQVACQPIRKYLRTRDDTVRQIVDGLTGDAVTGCAELASELSRGDPVTLEMQDSDEEGGDPEGWAPDPTDAVADKSGSKRRSSDIISLLVSIYGSKDIFINEYRTVLADRLLQMPNYHTAREIRNVELLKLRFGESHMHYCEVMLKDMDDSRRINGNICEEEDEAESQEEGVESAPAPWLSAIIFSSEFWPKLKEEKMEMPPLVQHATEAYTRRYEKLKAMRTLSWKPQLGSVTLDVELEDRTVSNVNASPLQAAIILLFQDKSNWSAEELSAELGVATEAVNRKLALWQQLGVLREEGGGRYAVQERAAACKDKAERGGGGAMVVVDSDDERDSNIAMQTQQREEKMQLFWAYVQAMLTNLECMTLERIHSLLRLFVATGPVVTEMDVSELEAFLQRKVAEHQLLMSSGVYRLPKNA